MTSTSRDGTRATSAAISVSVRALLDDKKGLRRADTVEINTDEMVALEHALAALAAVARRGDEACSLDQPRIVARADPGHEVFGTGYFLGTPAGAFCTLPG